MATQRTSEEQRTGTSQLLQWVGSIVGGGGLLFLLLVAGIVGINHGVSSSGASLSLGKGSPSPGVAPWRRMIQQVSRQTGVPAPWIAAEISVESQGNAHAGSLAGAYGLMQLEPGTLALSNRARSNPLKNMRAGAQYLALLHHTFHSWREASAAYYGGQGLVTALLPHSNMSWARAKIWLNVVPNPRANQLTLRQYADHVWDIAQQWKKGGKIG